MIANYLIRSHIVFSMLDIIARFVTDKNLPAAFISDRGSDYHVTRVSHGEVTLQQTQVIGFSLAGEHGWDTTFDVGSYAKTISQTLTELPDGISSITNSLRQAKKRLSNFRNYLLIEAIKT